MKQNSFTFAKVYLEQCGNQELHKKKNKDGNKSTHMKHNFPSASLLIHSKVRHLKTTRAIDTRTFQPWAMHRCQRRQRFHHNLRADERWYTKRWNLQSPQGTPCDEHNSTRPWLVTYCSIENRSTTQRSWTLTTSYASHRLRHTCAWTIALHLKYKR